MEIEKPEESINQSSAVPEANGMTKSSRGAETKVQVALRVRPPISKEILNKDTKCVECYTMTNQVHKFPSSFSSLITFLYICILKKFPYKDDILSKCLM